MLFENIQEPWHYGADARRKRLGWPASALPLTVGRTERRWLDQAASDRNYQGTEMFFASNVNSL